MCSEYIWLYEVTSYIEKVIIESVGQGIQRSQNSKIIIVAKGLKHFRRVIGNSQCRKCRK